jgi:prolyl 4-hydroxylase
VTPAPWRAGTTKIQTLHRELPVLLVRDFASAVECAQLVSEADGCFLRSKVVCDDPAGCVDTARTSDTAMLPASETTRALQERARLLTGYARVEPLQVVRYGASQEYKPHLDAFDRDTPEGRASICSSGGRRAATILVYLNNPQSGGETIFPELGLSVCPMRGAGVFWKNLTLDGHANTRARHGGAPVRSGVKYALNVWLIEPEPAVRC